MRHICKFVLTVTVLGGMARGVEPRVAVPVYVETTKGDDGQFSDMLKVEMMKRRGLIKAKVDIVRKPEAARYIIEASITYQRDRRRRSVWRTDRPSAVASVFAYNQCGALVWSKTKGDKNIFGDADGVIETAQKVAASFKEALAKKKSRLNRSLPCVLQEEGLSAREAEAATTTPASERAAERPVLREIERPTLRRPVRPQR